MYTVPRQISSACVRWLGTWSNSNPRVVAPVHRWSGMAAHRISRPCHGHGRSMGRPIGLGTACIETSHLPIPLMPELHHNAALMAPALVHHFCIICDWLWGPFTTQRGVEPQTQSEVWVFLRHSHNCNHVLSISLVNK